MWLWLTIASAIGQSFMGDIQQSIEESSTVALKALYYSGRDFNDLGKYESCIKELEFKYALLGVKYDVVNAYLGLCVPKSCSRNDLVAFFARCVEYAGLEDTIRSNDIKIYFPEEYNSVSMPLSTLLSIGVLAVPLILSILGTIISGGYFNTIKKDSTAFLIVKEFSLQSNIEKL